MVPLVLQASGKVSGKRLHNHYCSTDLAYAKSTCMAGCCIMGTDVASICQAHFVVIIRACQLIFASLPLHKHVCMYACIHARAELPNATQCTALHPRANTLIAQMLFASILRSSLYILTSKINISVWNEVCMQIVRLIWHQGIEGTHVIQDFRLVACIQEIALRTGVLSELSGLHILRADNI